jgi:hypothetical protein
MTYSSMSPKKNFVGSVQSLGYHFGGSFLLQPYRKSTTVVDSMVALLDEQEAMHRGPPCGCSNTDNPNRCTGAPVRRWTPPKYIYIYMLEEGQGLSVVQTMHAVVHSIRTWGPFESVCTYIVFCIIFYTCMYKMFALAYSVSCGIERCWL